MRHKFTITLANGSLWSVNEHDRKQVAIEGLIKSIRNATNFDISELTIKYTDKALLDDEAWRKFL